MPVAAYGSGAWDWCIANYEIVNRWQNNLLRKMLARPRIPDNEQYWQWLVVCTRLAREFFYDKFGLSGVLNQWLVSIHRVAGSIRHMNTAHDEPRARQFLGSCLMWMDGA